MNVLWFLAVWLLVGFISHTVLFTYHVMTNVNGDGFWNYVTQYFTSLATLAPTGLILSYFVYVSIKEDIKLREQDRERLSNK